MDRFVKVVECTPKCVLLTVGFVRKGAIYRRSHPLVSDVSCVLFWSHLDPVRGHDPRTKHKKHLTQFDGNAGTVVAHKDGVDADVHMTSAELHWGQERG